MKLRTYVGIFIWLGSFFFMTCSPLMGAEVCNRVVAIVNDDLITLYELNRKMEEVTGVNPDELKERDRKAYIETRKQVLELLINEKLAQEKIRELGIKVSPEEVDAAIEKIKQDNDLTHEDLLATLKAKGMTYEQYKESIRRNLERLRLINYEVKSKIIIREEEVKRFYEQHIDSFRTDKKVRLAMIFLPFKKGNRNEVHRSAQEIMDRLRRGEDFGTLAKAFSKGPNRERGGDLGLFKWEELDPKIRKLVEKLPEGGVTSPIIKPEGIKIIKVVRRYESGVRPYEEVKDAIYFELYQEEVNRRYEAWLKGLRESAYTKIIF